MVVYIHFHTTKTLEINTLILLFYFKKPLNNKISVYLTGYVEQNFKLKYTVEEWKFFQVKSLIKKS